MAPPQSFIYQALDAQRVGWWGLLRRGDGLCGGTSKRREVSVPGVMAYLKFKAVRETVAHNLMRKTGRPQRGDYTVC